MFGKVKRKGVPGRDRRYVIAAIVIGLVGLLASVAFLLDNCWFTVGCVLPPVTATPTYIPSRTPYPATSTALPSFTPTFIPASTPQPAMPPAQENLYDPYELRAFAINDDHSTIALSYWDGARGVLETRPWLDQRIGDDAATGVVSPEQPYELLSFRPNSRILIAAQEQDNNAEMISFSLEDKSIFPNTPTFYSPDGRWYAQAGSGQLVLYDEQKPVAHLTLEGIYDSVAFSPLGDTMAVVSRDGDDGYYLEVFDLTTETIERTHRRMFTGNLTSPVVYHPDGNMVAVADDLKILLVSLIGVPDFTVSTYNTPVRFIAFDLTRGILAAAGGNPDKGTAAMVYLFFLDETAVHPDSMRVQGIAIEDEVIGLQAVNGLFVGTRHSIASIRSFEDDRGIFGWTLEPILTTSNDGITLINQ